MLRQWRPPSHPISSIVWAVLASAWILRVEGFPTIQLQLGCLRRFAIEFMLVSGETLVQQPRKTVARLKPLYFPALSHIESDRLMEAVKYSLAVSSSTMVEEMGIKARDLGPPLNQRRELQGLILVFRIPF
ncbi:hypothetical protein BKA70DRAFT_794270 [Coprinopsis sp. MPI-PUGE-AT-0042]|nr:hypothetical protein BKA70DRAFT_794270 [Coprinopsis sp. MPI-PUGE-AT-0042]